MPSIVLYSWILHYKQLFTKHDEAKLDAPQTQGEFYPFYLLFPGYFLYPDMSHYQTLYFLQVILLTPKFSIDSAVLFIVMEIRILRLMSKRPFLQFCHCDLN